MDDQKIRLLGTFIALFTLSACGDLKDMHDATVSMNKTTSGMAQDTKALVPKMDNMNKAMGPMSDDTHGLSTKMDLVVTTINTLNKTVDTRMGSMDGKMTTMV